jgi:hypothetical protein
VRVGLVLRPASNKRARADNAAGTSTTASRGALVVIVNVILVDVPDRPSTAVESAT